MDIKLHKQATTTPKIRAEIQAAPAHVTDTALAERFGVSDMTIRRWRHRDDVYDRPHTRHNLKATLNHEQEEVLIAAREFLRLGLDDLLVVAREFLHQAPISAMKDWQNRRPELFTKRVINHPGPDTKSLN